MYRNRAWVLLDGDKIGKDAIERLQERYGHASWRPNSFRTFSRESFEAYYPERFSVEAQIALDTPDKQRRREAKRELLERVLLFAETKPEVATAEFKRSAAEVISILKQIEREIA